MREKLKNTPIIDFKLSSCSTSAIKHHTPGNNPKDYTQQIYQLFIQFINYVR
jgi:hypothetical protein